MVKEEKRLERLSMIGPFVTPPSSPSSQGDAAFEKSDARNVSDWLDGHDAVFGPYQVRYHTHYRGSCFKCDQLLDGPASERRRGGTTWFQHEPKCPFSLPKRRKR